MFTAALIALILAWPLITIWLIARQRADIDRISKLEQKPAPIAPRCDNCKYELLTGDKHVIYCMVRDRHIKTEEFYSCGAWQPVHSI